MVHTSKPTSISPDSGLNLYLSKRPWSIPIIFFLVLSILGACLPFIMGRLVDITTSVERQRTQYVEVSVKGDLSSSDLERAASLADTFRTFELTWTLSPFNSHGTLPAPIKFPWGTDMVYFAEVSRSQLLPNGTGLGTFDDKAMDPFLGTVDPNGVDSQREWKDGVGEQPGSLLRFPRWGVRTHCQQVANPEINLSVELFCDRNAGI